MEPAKNRLSVHFIRTNCDHKTIVLDSWSQFDPKLKQAENQHLTGAIQMLKIVLIDGLMVFMCDESLKQHNLSIF